MKIPEFVNGLWIDSLDNVQLLVAEGRLHKVFAKCESAEKKRKGTQYDMMRGPIVLMDAWQRWVMVNNEARARGLKTSRGR